MKTRLIQLISSFATTSGLLLGSTSLLRIHNSPKPTCVRLGSHREGDDANFGHHDVSRRSLLHSAGLSLAGVVSSGPMSAFLRSVNADPNGAGGGVNAANAMGLVHFPCHPGELLNTYHMMRAGESLLEAEDILSTNPLFLTNRDDALTELGVTQVDDACDEMMSKGINPSVVKYSLASKCIDTSNIVATKMMIGRNRIVPEFTFMDPRGAGIWDGKPLASTEAAIWAMDAAEAGNEGSNGKPPPNDDGTANETLFNQVTRLRQLMSILETQYSGDDILLVFPDGTSPALLSCLIAGIPLKNVHALNFMPGELRAGVNMNNSLQLLKERISSPTYTEAISVGQEELEKLRKEEKVKLLEKEEYTKPLLITKPHQVDSAPTKQYALMRGDRLQVKSPAPQKQYGLNGSRRLEDKDGATNLGPDFFSIGAIGAMGFMRTWRGNKDDTDESELTPVVHPSPVAPVMAFANSTGAVAFEPQIPVTSAAFTSENHFRSPTNVVQTTASNVVLDTSAGPNVFEDVPVLSKQDRIDAAEKAMESYLSQDDGGDDWLTSMQDIMTEE